MSCTPDQAYNHRNFAAVREAEDGPKRRFAARRTRLFQRVRAGEGVDRGGRISDWVKFENGAVSTEKCFAPGAWLARQMSASVIASPCQ